MRTCTPTPRSVTSKGDIMTSHQFSDNGIMMSYGAILPRFQFAPLNSQQAPPVCKPQVVRDGANINDPNNSPFDDFVTSSSMEAAMTPSAILDDHQIPTTVSQTSFHPQVSHQQTRLDGFTAFPSQQHPNKFQFLDNEPNVQSDVHHGNFGGISADVRNLQQ